MRRLRNNIYPFGVSITEMSKGELIFIGLGLSDDESPTVEAIESCRKADVLLAELYTSILTKDSIERLSKKIGKDIKVLGRLEVEEGKFIEELKDKRVGFLVPGDPMTATTHVDLRIRAHDLGMSTRIIHGTSAMVAVPGILGLQHYRFGRIVTIPFHQKGFEPTSPFELMVENFKRGMHTLVLLDIKSEEDRFMTANQGLAWLLSTAESMKSDIITQESLACVVARAGSNSCIAKADRIKELLGMDFGKPLHTIVIPGKLHFQEEEALVRFAGAPRELFGSE